MRADTQGRGGGQHSAGERDWKRADERKDGWLEAGMEERADGRVDGWMMDLDQHGHPPQVTGWGVLRVATLLQLPRVLTRPVECKRDGCVHSIVGLSDALFYDVDQMQRRHRTLSESGHDLVGRQLPERRGFVATQFSSRSWIRQNDDRQMRRADGTDGRTGTDKVAHLWTVGRVYQP